VRRREQCSWRSCCSPFEKPVRDLAFNLLGNGQGYPISIDVGSSELLLILVCSLFYLIAGVMHEGRRLSEENEGFI